MLALIGGWFASQGLKILWILAAVATVLAVLWGVRSSGETIGRIKEKQRNNDEQIKSIRVRRQIERSVRDMSDPERVRWLGYGGPK